MYAAPLRKRSLVTLLVLFSFLIAVASGIALFVWPGRGAGVAFAPLGLNHRTWEDLHIVGSVIFLVVAGYHLWLNRKALVNHVTMPAAPLSATGFRISREFFVGLAAGLAIAVTAVLSVPPATLITGLQTTLKGLW